MKLRWDVVFVVLCCCVVALAFIGACVEKSGLVVRALPLFVMIAVLLAGAGIACALKSPTPQGDSDEDSNRTRTGGRAGRRPAGRATRNGADHDR